MRFRLMSGLILAGCIYVMAGVHNHKLTLSPHTFGENLGISLIALVGMTALFGLIFGAGSDKK